MKWYDLLVTDEFVDYFSNDNNVYYEYIDDKGKYKPQPLFEKFIGLVNEITLAFTLHDLSPKALCRVKDLYPIAYMIYAERLTPSDNLSEIYRSIKTEKNQSMYQVDVDTLNAEQIAMMILYPFWSRMGGSFEIDFLESGDLKKYLLELKKRAGERDK